MDHDDRRNAIMEGAGPLLFSLPNVILTWLGTKIVNGQDTGTPAIVIHVLKKLPLSDLDARDIIPRYIDGVPTDVIESEPFSALMAEQAEPEGDLHAYRPRRGGARIGWNQEERLTGEINTARHRGTMGCIVRTRDAQALDVILTNQHVVATSYLETSAASVGREIGQPHNEACSACAPCCNHTIGRVLRTLYTPDVDAALIALDPGTKWSPEIIDIGPITGVLDLSFDKIGDIKSSPFFGMNVHKRGQRTGVTHGRLTNNTVKGPFPSPLPPPLPSEPPTRMLHAQMAVEKLKSTDPPFATNGDSGAVVVDDQSRVVGLLFGSNDVTTLLCPITTVLDQLHVDIVTAAAVGVVQKAPSYNYRDTPNALESRSAPDRVSDSTLGAIRRANEEIEETQAGRMLIDLFEKHGAELRALVGANRRIAATWHGYGGPAVMHNAMVAIQRGGPVLPRTIGNEPIERPIQRFLSLLRRYASDELGTEIDRNAGRIGGYAGLTYGELLERLRAEAIVLPS